MAESEEDRHLKLAGEFDCLPEPLPTLRHSTSHVMAEAVKQLFPEVRVAIGPAIEDGCYYDFLKATPFTPEDLERIEAAMRKIVAADQKFVRESCRARTPSGLRGRGEHQVEILRGIDAPTCRSTPGDFVTVPRPARHLDGRHQGLQAPVVLRSYCAGRAEPMLQRIYGTRGSPRQTSTSTSGLEEAKKRDHRKLGASRLVRVPRRRSGAPSGCPMGW